MLLILGIVAVVIVLIFIQQRRRRTTGPGTGASAIEVTQSSSLNIPDVGSHGMGGLNLPAFLPPPPTTLADFQKDLILNTDDHNIDPTIQMQWAKYEMSHQVNRGQPNPDGLPQTGQFWPHAWTPAGPIDPFAPRNQQTGEVTPGPQDPQLAYGMAIAGALNGQEQKFCVKEDPNDITYQYRNSLQQLPGSHYAVEGASFDGFDTPQVVNRFAYLPEMAAKWVVEQMNLELRKEHPCFSLAGREHFEISNPPMKCGDGSNPISLIRVFESRVKKMQDGTQRVYLTMEIGNLISAGAGGMFSTVVTMDAFQKFVSHEPVNRDKKHTFVLPRTRT